MAEQMIERHVKEAGSYPRQVGIVIWATDTMKTGDDDIAYVMYLLGVMPVWTANGSAMTGLKVIPVKDLGRPRIDVTLRISGLSAAQEACNLRNLHLHEQSRDSVSQSKVLKLMQNKCHNKKVCSLSGSRKTPKELKKMFIRIVIRRSGAGISR